MKKTKTEELVEATLIIGARRANPSLTHDTAKPLIESHVKNLSKRFDAETEKLRTLKNNISEELTGAQERIAELERLLN